METNIQNLNKVSFIFFAITGAAHIGSMLMLANNYSPELASLVHKTFDLPFLLSALIYGGSAFQIGLSKIGLQSRTSGAILTILLAIIFVAALYMNFFFSDLI